MTVLPQTADVLSQSSLVLRVWTHHLPHIDDDDAAVSLSLSLSHTALSFLSTLNPDGLC